MSAAIRATIGGAVLVAVVLAPLGLAVYGAQLGAALGFSAWWTWRTSPSPAGWTPAHSGRAGTAVIGAAQVLTVLALAMIGAALVGGGR
jgi:hypothetical protein